MHAGDAGMWRCLEMEEVRLENAWATEVVETQKREAAAANRGLMRQLAPIQYHTRPAGTSFCYSSLV